MRRGGQGRVGKGREGFEAWSALDVRRETLRFKTGKWASDTERGGDIFEIIFRVNSYFSSTSGRIPPLGRSKRVRCETAIRIRSSPFLFGTHPMTITHRKRQPQPPEEIQSPPSFFSPISTPNSPCNSRDGAWSPDRVRQLSLRSHPLRQNQVRRSRVRARRRRGHLPFMFLQWTGIRQAQARPPISRGGMSSTS